MAKQFKSLDRPKTTEIPPDVPAGILFPSNSDRDPKYTSDSATERLEEIVEKEKAKEINEKAYEEFKSVTNELKLSQAVLLSSARTIDAIRPTFLYSIDKASEAIDKLKEFEEMVSNVQSITLSARLDKESVDTLSKYNRIMVDQEGKILKEHLRQLQAELDEYYKKVATTIKSGECVCLPFKLFLWLFIIFLVMGCALLLIAVFSIW